MLKKGGVEMTVHSEIPSTPFALNQYANLVKKQIRENRNHSRRLGLRFQWCLDKAKAMDINLNIIEH